MAPVWALGLALKLGLLSGKKLVLMSDQTLARKLD